MEELKTREKTNGMTGRSIMCAFQRGAIPALLAEGLNLEQSIRIAKKLGLQVYESQVDNIIPTVGKSLMGDMLVGVEPIGLTYHAIGTGTATPVSGDTQLATEVARLAATTRSRAGQQITVSTFYVAAACTYHIYEAGVFGGSLAGVTANSGALFSHYLQEYDNSAGLVDLTFTYICTIG